MHVQGDDGGGFVSRKVKEAGDPLQLVAVSSTRFCERPLTGSKDSYEVAVSPFALRGWIKEVSGVDVGVPQSMKGSGAGGIRPDAIIALLVLSFLYMIHPEPL